MYRKINLKFRGIVMKKISLIILSILVFSIFIGCSRPSFNGSRTSNNKQFLMEYSVLNTTETSEMELKEGTIIDAEVESKGGRVNILVESINGGKIYTGENVGTGKFSLKIKKSDTYKFTVTGDNAKGSISFKVAD
jgi:hypothetical protein